MTVTKRFTVQKYRLCQKTSPYTGFLTNRDKFCVNKTFFPRFKCKADKRVTFLKAVYITRTCAVAQYAVLEANAEVNGRRPFSHPNPSETPQPISMSCQIYYYVPQKVDVQNLVGIDLAVTDLRIRQKTRFV